MADIVTDGRVIMGVGRGYHTREVETVGAPLLDSEANRRLFEEQLQLLLKCFNEEAFHHAGKYYQCPPSLPYRGYQLEEITLVPRPKHLPVEIWMPIASGRTIDERYKWFAPFGFVRYADEHGRTWGAPGHAWSTGPGAVASRWRAAESVVLWTAL